MIRLPLHALAGLALAFAATPLFAQSAPVVQTGHPSNGGICPAPPMVFPDCPAPGGSGTVPPSPNPDGTGSGGGATDSDVAALSERGGGAGIGESAEFNPIFGDLIGVHGQQVIIVPHGVTRAAVALPSRTVFNIAENESPRPTDRIFFNYDYFNNVAFLPQGTPGSNADLHRETIGFEKTFLNGDASFGMRLPFVQLTGSRDLEDSQVDDLSLVFKYAFINNRQTGNVLSGGLVLTVPTGPGLPIEGEATVHSTVFQPFIGFIYHFNRDLYLQGFSSIAAPTDSRDVTIAFNSIAAGYHLYRAEDPSDFLVGITPVAEFHVNTPLNHRGVDNGPINFPDAVDFTGGVYLQFRRATLGLAVGTPLTGPRPYDVEAKASLNIHF